MEYSVTDLNLQGVAKSVEPRYTHFNLYAVSNHYGTMNGGHYTAYCRNVEYDRWYKFDDCNVMELKGREVRSSNAYILFYTARDYQVPQVAALDGWCWSVNCRVTLLANQLGAFESIFCPICTVCRIIL